MLGLRSSHASIAAGGGGSRWPAGVRLKAPELHEIADGGLEGAVALLAIAARGDEHAREVRIDLEAAADCEHSVQSRERAVLGPGVVVALEAAKELLDLAREPVGVGRVERKVDPGAHGEQALLE